MVRITLSWSPPICEAAHVDQHLLVFNGDGVMGLFLETYLGMTLVIPSFISYSATGREWHVALVAQNPSNRKCFGFRVQNNGLGICLISGER